MEMIDTEIQYEGGSRPTRARLLYGISAIEGLQKLPDNSVHMVCTSPPYWGQRDYGAGEDEIGKEASVEDFIANLRAVFQEVRRVLRPDGTLWLNIGDKYRNKRLLDIPAKVVVALKEIGFLYREEIIWFKTNPQPTSAENRGTVCHEKILFFSNSPNYFFDVWGLREPPRKGEAVGRNLLGVWAIAVKPFAGAHLATFPPEIPRRCILRGSSDAGACVECGAPLKRLVEKDREDDPSQGKRWFRGGDSTRQAKGAANREGRRFKKIVRVRTTGWKPSCNCQSTKDPVPCVVLDPFSGSSTTGMVGLPLGRDFIGIDLNEDFLDMASSRILGRDPAPQEAPQESEEPDVFDMFKQED